MQMARVASTSAAAWRLWLIAIVAGLIAGSASLLPYFATAGPAHLLGNSAAIWLACAFAVGAVADRPLRAAIAGALTLLITLAAFAAGVQVLYPANDVASGMLRVIGLWLVPAIVGGSLYGTLGRAWRSGTSFQHGLASAAMGAAFVAEAAYTAGTGRVAALIEALVGLAVTLTLARGRRARLVAVCSLPILVAAGVLAWFLAWHLVRRFATAGF
jgi:putative effector of murein hydrolase LrgA (UPF0299 family)